MNGIVDRLVDDAIDWLLHDLLDDPVHRPFDNLLDDPRRARLKI